MESCAYPHYRGEGCGVVKAANDWAAKLFAHLKRTKVLDNPRSVGPFTVQFIRTMSPAQMERCNPLQYASISTWARVHENFTRTVYPQAVHSLPLVYMLSGADLLSALSFFPNAPSYHLFSEFPPGQLTCFANAKCSELASQLVTAYFYQWCKHNYGWTATDDQQRWFLHLVPEPERAPIGTLPVLVFMLHLMGHRITGSSPADTHGFINGVALSTNRSMVTYTGGFLGDDHNGMVKNASLMAAHLASANRSSWHMPTVSRTGQPYPMYRKHLALLHHTVWSRHSRVDFSPGHGEHDGHRRPFLYLIKAAPAPFLLDPHMATFVTETAAAVMQDDLALPPAVFKYANRSSPFVPWVHACYGRWHGYGQGTHATFWRQHEVAALCANGDQPELDFQFGYGEQKHGNASINGTLITAWREDVGERGVLAAAVLAAEVSPQGPEPWSTARPP